VRLGQVGGCLGVVRGSEEHLTKKKVKKKAAMVLSTMAACHADETG
jgi:hypothetical protein